MYNDLYVLMLYVEEGDNTLGSNNRWRSGTSICHNVT